MLAEAETAINSVVDHTLPFPCVQPVIDGCIDFVDDGLRLFAVAKELLDAGRRISSESVRSGISRLWEVRLKGRRSGRALSNYALCPIRNVRMSRDACNQM